MKRIYFWFRGVRKDRLGGPWWYRDFKTERERMVFFQDLRFFLEAVAETDGHEVFEPGKPVAPPHDKIRFFP